MPLPCTDTVNIIQWRGDEGGGKKHGEIVHRRSSVECRPRLIDIHQANNHRDGHNKPLVLCAPPLLVPMDTATI